MAPPRGTRAERAERTDGEAGSRWLFAFGRLIGFSLTGGLAVALIAAVVLVPPYTRLVRARYERDIEQARTDDMLAMAGAQERLIAALPHDRVLIRRLAMSQGKLRPVGGSIYHVATAGPAAPPGLIQVQPRRRPDPPAKWLVALCGRLERQRTRRGLIMLAIGCLVVALFLFSPPRRYQNKTKTKT